MQASIPARRLIRLAVPVLGGIHHILHHIHGQQVAPAGKVLPLPGHLLDKAQSHGGCVSTLQQRGLHPGDSMLTAELPALLSIAAQMSLVSCAGRTTKPRESTDRPVWHVLVGDVPLGVLIPEGKEAMGILETTWDSIQEYT